MPIVNIAIGKSRYHIECPDSEKDRLIELAEKVNEKVNDLALKLRDIDEKTLLVIALLNIEDELENATKLLNSDTKDEDIKNISAYLKALKVRIGDKF